MRLGPTEPRERARAARGGRRCARGLGLGLVAGLILLCPSVASAYIDPLSGSVFLQVLAAGALGALFLVKSWWRQLLALIRRVWSRLAGR